MQELIRARSYFGIAIRLFRFERWTRALGQSFATAAEWPMKPVVLAKHYPTIASVTSRNQIKSNCDHRYTNASGQGPTTIAGVYPIPS